MSLAYVRAKTEKLMKNYCKLLTAMNVCCSESYRSTQLDRI